MSDFSVDWLYSWLIIEISLHVNAVGLWESLSLFTNPFDPETGYLSSLQVARLTHSISVFTEGILMMKTTLVGIIKVLTYWLPSLSTLLSLMIYRITEFSC